MTQWNSLVRLKDIPEGIIYQSSVYRNLYYKKEAGVIKQGRKPNLIDTLVPNNRRIQLQEFVEPVPNIDIKVVNGKLEIVYDEARAELNVAQLEGFEVELKKYNQVPF